MTDCHLTCDEAALLISASLDGEISPEEQSSLDEHLAGCPACRRALADATSLRQLVCSSLCTPNDGLTANVRAAVRADARFRRQSRLARRASAAAAALLVAAGLLLAGQSVRMAQRNVMTDDAAEAQHSDICGGSEKAPTDMESTDLAYSASTGAIADDEAKTDRGNTVIAGTGTAAAALPSAPEETKLFSTSAAAGGCFLAAAAILIAARRKETQ